MCHRHSCERSLEVVGNGMSVPIEFGVHPFEFFFRFLLFGYVGDHAVEPDYFTFPVVNEPRRDNRREGGTVLSLGRVFSRGFSYIFFYPSSEVGQRLFPLHQYIGYGHTFLELLLGITLEGKSTHADIEEVTFEVHLEHDFRERIGKFSVFVFVFFVLNQHSFEYVVCGKNQNQDKRGGDKEIYRYRTKGVPAGPVCQFDNQGGTLTEGENADKEPLVELGRRQVPRGA